MEAHKTDHSNMKLGKSPAVHDPRTLLMANYLTPDALPPTPAKYVYAKNIPANGWGMMVNDKIGDCTCAAAGHLIMEWTDDNGALFTPSDQDIVNAYSAITGYNPVTGKNDNGAVETNVLNYWRKNGIAGHKIMAYASLEPKNESHIKLGTFLFGGCYIGVSLPLTAQTQKVWSVPPGGAAGRGAPGSWGGHAVCVVGYDSHGLTVITWGATKKMTWSFWNAYCDEAYVLISTDFAAGKTAPSGFDLAALQADLKLIVA
ncbi:hypothetical protein [Mucilaginibacter gotjawali]|uniref:Uncharacterized protein n=2 Tax=Mucilaginibacter gotjawali TaxID=1550579 RepID=A0A0X8X2L3_9SPHI|nr:hypothetical protein [Mucilaginibacter gotjawali]MBB3053743.1 hypothetical protein [Mucilaginibacter gotjawali]BAU54003.1 hypothetical protein MgSA37_02174 [Mucilaginibacter gotjawali]